MYLVDPTLWDMKEVPRNGIVTDSVHARDSRSSTKNTNSEAVKVLKVWIIRQIIEKHKIEQALIFVRTRLDADLLHQYFRSLDGMWVLNSLL